MKKFLQLKKIHVGTSGWHYAYWKGPFYAKDASLKDLLISYSKEFDTVEVNNTFYRLPSLKTVRHWKQEVCSDFIFSIKVSRYVTHIKRLRDPKKAMKKFFRCIEPLKNQIGVILFLIPEHVGVDLQRLEFFLKSLPKNFHYAFEFRNPSWFDQKIYALLKKYNTIFCIHDFEGCHSPKIVTSSYVYVRLHGPKAAYQGSYSLKHLRNLAKELLKWAKEDKEVFCYFNNDERGFAPKNALTLLKLLKADKL